MAICDKDSEATCVKSQHDTPTHRPKLAKGKSFWFKFGVVSCVFLLANLLCELCEPLLFSFCLTKGFHTAEKVSLYIDSDVTPDVIFLGSSRVPTGLNPAVAEQMLSQNNLNVRVLNLGIVASGLDINYRVLKNIIRKDKKPKLIVYGLSEFDLFGLIPGNNKYDSISRVPYANYLLRLDDFGNYSGNTLEKKADFLLNRLIPIYRDQKLFQDAIKTQFRLDRKQIILGKSQIDGFIPKPNNPFTPAQIAQEDVGYRFIIPSYNLDDPDLSEFNKLAGLAKSMGIRLILVNMPVSPQFQSYWQDETKVAKYCQLVDRIAAKKHLPVLNDYQASAKIFPPESFWNTNHLSTVGAEILTKRLTENYLLPYFKSTRAPAEFYRADFKDLVLPSHLVAGASATGQITVKNTSSSTWPIGDNAAVCVSYHWLNEQGQPVVKEGLRSHFDQPVLPGQEGTLHFNIDTPPLGGRYILEMDLVYEHMGWFGTKGNPTLRVPVLVETSSGE